MKDRLRTLRKKLGYNQTELGRLLGYKAATVSSWEVGAKIPEPARLLICSLFNVSRVWLETGEGDMFQQDAALDNSERVKRLAGDLVALLPKKERRAFIDSVKELEKSL
ncbi:MAG: helix-turn-helix transcriptional regulator [Thermoguttaceae bacterium]|nr:helix-turn-helix transcriptional regulator [Thermoguttaceae bacterium]